MAGDFRGSGIRFPLLPDASGSLLWIDGDDNILQSLRLLLSTIVSERIMRPDFGTKVATFLFEGDSEQNVRQLERAVRDAVTQFEPRVSVDDVRASLVEGREGVVQVSVAVRVLRTNSQRNLVFPFYVGTSEGGT